MAKLSIPAGSARAASGLLSRPGIRFILRDAKSRASSDSPTQKSSHFRRCAFLGGLATAPLASLASGSLATAHDKPIQGLNVRETEPRNLETPFLSLDGFSTPSKRFYIRNHFAMPKLTAESWRLKIEGAVVKTIDLGLEELRGMPSQTVTAMLECAGNGRVLLVPKSKGLLWESGAVGNAVWTGVPLKALLERAGVKDGAIDFILKGFRQGQDRGGAEVARRNPLRPQCSDHQGPWRGRPGLQDERRRPGYGPRLSR